VLKSVFLLGIILSTIVFTPFAFGQELKKATWLESISVVYDQKFTKSIQSSVAFETINNNEIQFSDEFIAKIMSHQEIRFVFFTNMEECVLGVELDEQCIMIGFDLNLLKGDLGINAIHENGQKIADELITDINNEFGVNAEFHSIFMHMDDGSASPIGDDLTTTRTVSAVFTLPREESATTFTKLSEQLINQQLRESGGFYDVAKELANKPDSIITVGINAHDTTPIMLFKVTHQERGGLGWVETEDGGAMLEYQFSVTGFDISKISPLMGLGIDKLERSKHFDDNFVPLNSVVQVIILPEYPSKVNLVNTNIIEKLDTVEDISENGWFFTSTSHDHIDARYLFGTLNSVTANELVMEIDSSDMLIQTENDSISTDDIKVGMEDSGVEQYAILIAIAIAAVGAAVFYLKGYKRNR
jgi:hypothetical protein